MLARRAALVFALVLGMTFAADQGSKAWAHGLPTQPAGCAQPGEMLAQRCAGVPQALIEGLWDWELAYNPGVAFSTFAAWSGHRAMQVVLALLALAALVGIAALALRTAPGERAKRVAYALIAGGALGNLVDRLRDGAVTDFIRWKFQEHRWPIFNLADAALVAGVILMLLAGRRASERSGDARAPGAPQGAGPAAA